MPHSAHLGVEAVGFAEVALARCLVAEGNRQLGSHLEDVRLERIGHTYHRGSVHNARNNLSAYEQGKRGVLSGRVTLQFARGRTEVALWGRNLLDREYLLAGAPDFDGAFGSEAIQFAAPRRFGIELPRRFGG